MRIRTSLLATVFAAASASALSQSNLSQPDLSDEMQSWAGAVAERGQVGATSEEVHKTADAARDHEVETNGASGTALASDRGIDLDVMLSRYKVDKRSVEEGLTTPAAFYVFVSFSQDRDYLKRLFADVSKAGGKLVIRGFVNGKQLDTIKAMAAVQGVNLDKLTENSPKPDLQGMILDPTAFERFGVTVVPTFVVAAKNPPCQDAGCDDDTPPAFDKLAGQVSVEYALRTLSEKGESARKVALDALRKFGA